MLQHELCDIARSVFPEQPRRYSWLRVNQHDHFRGCERAIYKLRNSLNIWILSVVNINPIPCRIFRPKRRKGNCKFVVQLSAVHDV